jgi:hypothetical protein
MKILLFSASLIFLNISCNNNSSKQTNSGNNEKRIIQLEPFSFSSSNENKFKNFDEFKKGHIEKFENDNISFRLLMKSDTSKLFDLQVEKGGVWETNLNLPLQLTDYSLTTDMDKDGVNDLAFGYRGNVKIYLYNKSSKSFIVTPIEVPDDCVTLDPEKVIYGSNNKIGNVWDVEIFSIVDKRKYYFYKAKINVVDEAYYRMVNSVVYKCKNGNLADTILFKKENLSKDLMLNRYMKDLMNIK